MVFRFLLPAFWIAFLGGLILNRHRVRRDLGRDPVVLRSIVEAKYTRGLLDLLLRCAIVVVTIDVALNAVMPDTIASTIAVPLLRASSLARYIGLALLTLAGAIIGVAILQMGLSWRMGIDDVAPGELVTRGLYSRVRHPIYSGLILGLIGIALVTADALSIAVAAGGLVAVAVQARLEEEFLGGRYAHYNDYMSRTGRFWP